MSICISSETCGTNGDYNSAEKGVTFVLSDSNTCILSSDDYTTGEIGSDCSFVKDGCTTGLTCAVNINDGNGND